MTPEEFKDAMSAINDEAWKDPEMAQSEADNLMCEMLSSLGYGEGVEVFRNMERW